VANPGSPETILLAGGNLMMYVDRQEGREDRDGTSAKRRADPEAWAKYQAQLLQMPAGRRPASEIDALAACPRPTPTTPCRRPGAGR
jgi:hypothetical protein